PEKHEHSVEGRLTPHPNFICGARNWRLIPHPSGTSNLTSGSRNRFSTFCSNREMLFSKLFTGRQPQKVIEPVENTAPLFGVSKKVMSAWMSCRGGSPGIVVRWVS